MVLNRDWMFSSKEYLCEMRTVGVLVRNNRILVQCNKERTEYALPGGHIKIGETLEDALKREYKEETGITIKCNRLLWSEECFWKLKGKQVHNFAYYFIVEEDGGYIIPDNGEFVSIKDNRDYFIGWMSFDEIQKVTIYPQFLKREVYHLDSTMRHFISEY